jgi:hypothetical protein
VTEELGMSESETSIRCHNCSAVVEVGMSTPTYRRSYFVETVHHDDGPDELVIRVRDSDEVLHRCPIRPFT